MKKVLLLFVLVTFSLVVSSAERTLFGDCFDSKEKAKDVTEYVLTLPFPADLETMKTFFKEVISGKLEFRCHYPVGDFTCIDLIKGLGELDS